eukprot:5083005-Lingulodinium_polyedra.AAC.1
MARVWRVRACVEHFAALKWRSACLTASLRSVSRQLRDDAVEPAFRRFSASKCATHARATRAP